MGRPDDELTQKAKAVLRAVRDDGDGLGRSALARLDAFFPSAAQFAWLDDESDTTLQSCFTNEADGGWLEPGQDAEFWQLIVDLDIGQSGWQAPEALAGLLERVATAWESAAERARGSAESAARFAGIGPVPGTDYPGWWQGYDTVDQAWKYVYSGGDTPGDATAGWVLGEVAFAGAVEQSTAAGGPATADDRAERDEAVYALDRQALRERPEFARIDAARRLALAAAVVDERFQRTGRWSA